MNQALLATVSSTDVALFGILILVVFLFFFALCVFGYWLSCRPDSVSPYTRLPMRRGMEISFYARQQVLRFLYDMLQYDNRIFEFKRAAVCRETGRIFPNAIAWYGKIKLDWTFLQKRHPGTYVSWGSLTADQQEVVRASHDTLAGFQVEFSSHVIQPKGIEAKYAFAKPGPLYVDINTHVLLGWKCVPETELEVLIVQKPLNLITLSVGDLMEPKQEESKKK